MRSPADRDVAALLRTGPLEPVGRFTAASNAALLCDVAGGVRAVYKPQRGERPLWDFPAGTLHRREVAAYVVDGALGWDAVPVTVLRDDGPFGPGSVQLYVDHDPGEHYFSLMERDDDDVRAQLRRMVVFDLLVNNADRKGGHVLATTPGRVWLIDHGVCFHHEPKLRTVAWDFAGDAVPSALRAELDTFADRLDDAGDEVARELGGLLRPEECGALARRARAVSAAGVLPAPSGPRPFPWPLL